ncbi:hypothetical protein GOODEAATRI_016942, partial [Goodea atripinnis]
LFCRNQLLSAQEESEEKQPEPTIQNYGFWKRPEQQEHFRTSTDKLGVHSVFEATVRTILSVFWWTSPGSAGLDSWTPQEADGPLEVGLPSGYSIAPTRRRSVGGRLTTPLPLGLRAEGWNGWKWTNAQAQEAGLFGDQTAPP